jgi:hypothetical protein
VAGDCATVVLAMKVLAGRAVAVMAAMVAQKRGGNAFPAEEMATELWH